MLRHLILTVSALALLLSACQNDSKSGGEADSTDTASMAQFAEDEEFQNAHDDPEAANAKNAGKMIEFPTPDGESAKAYALMADSTVDDYLLVFHEWWGLNGHIKEEAERLKEELDSVHVIALDLYDGEVAKKKKAASRLMKRVKEDRVRSIIKGALNKAGEEARIGTIGWCFGGGWSLKASIMAGERGEACVMYYGMPVKTREAIEPLQAPILAIFAMKDDWITPEKAKEFKALVTETGKTMQLQMFNAKHAFANPSNPNYDAQAAKAAQAAAMAFLKKNLTEVEGEQ